MVPVTALWGVVMIFAIITFMCQVIFKPKPNWRLMIVMVASSSIAPLAVTIQLTQGW